MWRLLAPRLRRYAWRKSVGEGRHVWFSLWIVVAGAQVIRRFTVARPVIEHLELREGDSIVITDLGRLDET
jgi:hypothetical protein